MNVQEIKEEEYIREEGDSLFYYNEDRSLKIDLTRMYGYGNEPRTIEEFKEFFPRDHYLYKSSGGGLFRK